MAKTLAESPESKARINQSKGTALDGIKEVIGSVKQKRSDGGFINAVLWYHFSTMNLQRAWN